MCNVKDTSIFPAMSKHVTAVQGENYGGLVLEGEQLWTCVQQVWNDLPLTTIARAYTAHHQIVNAIYRDEGGDQHMQEKNGLHHGVRRMCLPYFADDDVAEPVGVEILESLKTDIAEDLEARGLKYTTPDVSELSMAEFLSSQELYALESKLPHESAEYCAIQEQWELQGQG